jgi:ABC-type multidrug transport system fused ATPase/permease subunit
MLAEYNLVQVFFTMLWFFLFFIWIWLLISVFGDIFRSRDLSGVAKALWVIGVIIFPYLGVFLYLLIRGGKMHEHAVEDAKAADDATRAYIREAAGTSASPAEELSRLADLKERGIIDDAEFAALKAKVLS